jgi:hypothetical protein
LIRKVKTWSEESAAHSNAGGRTSVAMSVWILSLQRLTSELYEWATNIYINIVTKRVLFSRQLWRWITRNEMLLKSI